MSRQPLTSPEGPVVVSEKTLRALVSIRRAKLLPALFGQVWIERSNFEALADVLSDAPPWLIVHDDLPQQRLPARVAVASDLDLATLRLALSVPASLVLLDGAVKERAKLSFIKAEGTVSILVSAYRQDMLSAVRPMVKALEELGHADVLPPPDQLEALWHALAELRDGSQ